MILWRAIALVGVLIAACVCADSLHHQSFESGAVGNALTPHYFVSCERLEFNDDVTVATLRISDTTPFAQFSDYRQASTRGPAPYLYIPASYSLTAGWLQFVRYDELPDVLLVPKSNNNIHEAIVKIAFQPLTKLRSDAFNVDEVYLAFPGFRPFPVRRVAPLSQSQDSFTDLHNAIARSISPQVARVFLALGAFAFCGIVGDTYRHRDVLIYRWKVKHLQLRGVSMQKAQRAKEGTEEGEVLLPPRWDEQLIEMQFRNLAHRPSMLAAFVNGVKDRFVHNQDDKTAIVRIKYLRSKVEELKLLKELQHEYDDLSFREADLDIRRLEQKLKQADLADRVQTRAELREAEHKRDLLRVNLETEQIKKQIRDLKPPSVKETGTSTRTALIQEQRDRMQRLKEARAYARETVKDPDELKRQENLYDDQIAQCEEKLSSLL